MVEWVPLNGATVENGRHNRALARGALLLMCIAAKHYYKTFAKALHALTYTALGLNSSDFALQKRVLSDGIACNVRPLASAIFLFKLRSRAIALAIEGTIRICQSNNREHWQDARHHTKF